VIEPDPYFAVPTERPVRDGKFVRIESLDGFELAPGLTLRPVVGENVMLSFARYEPHAEAPLHAHVEEQLFVVLEGEFEVELGGETRTLGVGDAALIPSWVPHRVRAGAEPAYQLDVFTPPRQGLLDRMAAASA
jgi:quercetin dioxygenase-like cupin family protein